jgi:hypothetical protein
MWGRLTASVEKTNNGKQPLQNMLATPTEKGKTLPVAVMSERKSLTSSEASRDLEHFSQETLRWHI